jgi:hypothetical protein
LEGLAEAAAGQRRSSQCLAEAAAGQRRGSQCLAEAAAGQRRSSQCLAEAAAGQRRGSASLERHPLPRSWWVLSLAPRPHILTRTADDTLEMEVVNGVMLTGQVESLFRRPEFPFARGDEVQLEGLRITIVKVDVDGRPVRVRYELDVSVDDSSLVFLLATKRGLIRYPIGPVKATMPIPPAMLPLVLDLDAQARAATGG